MKLYYSKCGLCKLELTSKLEPIVMASRMTGQVSPLSEVDGGLEYMMSYSPVCFPCLKKYHKFLDIDKFIDNPEYMSKEDINV